jgi:hypothetical protein
MSHEFYNLICTLIPEFGIHNVNWWVFYTYSIHACTLPLQPDSLAYTLHLYLYTNRTSIVRNSGAHDMWMSHTSKTFFYPALKSRRIRFLLLYTIWIRIRLRIYKSWEENHKQGQKCPMSVSPSRVPLEVSLKVQSCRGNVCALNKPCQQE